MDHLVGLKAEGKIKNIGLTNFDTTHMQGLMDRGAPIVSNQVKPSTIKLCLIHEAVFRVGNNQWKEITGTISPF